MPISTYESVIQAFETYHFVAILTELIVFGSKYISIYFQYTSILTVSWTHMEPVAGFLISGTPNSSVRCICWLYLEKYLAYKLDGYFMDDNRLLILGYYRSAFGTYSLTSSISVSSLYPIWAISCNRNFGKKIFSFGYVRIEKNSLHTHLETKCGICVSSRMKT